MLDFSNDFILWGIDGTWMTRYIPKMYHLYQPIIVVIYNVLI